MRAINREIKSILPFRIYSCISKLESESGLIEEIRLRRKRQAYVICSGKNIILPIIVTDNELDEIILAISHNSLYAYRDTIAKGYISLDDGVRVGIIGRASAENNEIVGVYDISELAFRIPNKIKVKCNELIDLISKNNLLHSTLIYSPPGIGKTTLLRSIIKELASGSNAKRVAVIDTRGELGFSLEENNLLVSILSGYPRKNGIEIATRTMNAQIIVCDEIGNDDDASSIIDTQGAGVTLIATCHGKSVSDILSHSGVFNLHKKRIFDYYVGIDRGDNMDFVYTISGWEEANAHL